MLGNPDNRAALVTGAAQRLGRGIAMRLAQMGYHVAAAFHSSEAKAESLADEIREMGLECATASRDLRVNGEAAALAKWAIETFPGLRVVVNNASTYNRGSISNSSSGDIMEAMSLHLAAPFAITRQFAESGGTGLVVNMLDSRIRRSRTDHFAYLMSKKALAEFTKTAAVELAPGIRVNGIAPGLILPPEGESEEYMDALAESVPLKRSGTIEDVLDVVEFLERAEYMTGQIIYVDGGLGLVG